MAGSCGRNFDGVVVDSDRTPTDDRGIGRTVAGHPQTRPDELRVYAAQAVSGARHLVNADRNFGLNAARLIGYDRGKEFPFLHRCLDRLMPVRWTALHVSDGHLAVLIDFYLDANVNWPRYAREVRHVGIDARSQPNQRERRAHLDTTLFLAAAVHFVQNVLTDRGLRQDLEGLCPDRIRQADIACGAGTIPRFAHRGDDVAIVRPHLSQHRLRFVL